MATQQCSILSFADLHAYLYRKVESGTETVVWVQKTFQCRFLDIVLPAVAFFGTEECFITMLPLLFWNGHWLEGFFLCQMLAFALYLTGFGKDVFSLPRPFCPPVSRKESNYNLEPGFPSTHSLTSSAIVVYLVLKHSAAWEAQWTAALVAMWLLLLFGRIYLGMHTPVDIVGGVLIGLALGALTIWLDRSQLLQHVLAATSSCSVATSAFAPDHCPSWHHMYFPLTGLLIYIVCLVFYPDSPYSTPCFTDAVSFMGVGAGVLLSFWRTGGEGHAMSAQWDSAEFLRSTFLARLVVGSLTMAPMKFALNRILRRVVFLPLSEVIGMNSMGATMTTSTTNPLSSISSSSSSISRPKQSFAIVNQGKNIDRKTSSFDKDRKHAEQNPLVDYPARFLAYLIMSYFNTDPLCLFFASIGLS